MQWYQYLYSELKNTGLLKKYSVNDYIQLLTDLKKIKIVSEKTNAPYLDMTYLNAQTLFTDDNHIYKKDGKEISELIGKWILQQK